MNKIHFEARSNDVRFRIETSACPACMKQYDDVASMMFPDGNMAEAGILWCPCGAVIVLENGMLRTVHTFSKKD